MHINRLITTEHTESTEKNIDSSRRSRCARWLIFNAFLSSILLMGAQTVKVGSDTYGKVELESLELTGACKLNGTTISKLLKITGNLNARSAHLETLEAEGAIKLTDSVAVGPAAVTGSLQAFGSEFSQTIAFTGQKALFSNCKLHGITIRRDAAFKARQVVELKGSTVVDGPIVFEGGGGAVFLYPGAKVLGSISGGKIIQKR